MAASHVDRIERQISQGPPAAAIASGRRSVNRRSVDKADMNPCVPVSAHLHKITAIFPSFFSPIPFFPSFIQFFFLQNVSAIFSFFPPFFPICPNFFHFRFVLFFIFFLQNASAIFPIFFEFVKNCPSF